MKPNVWIDISSLGFIRPVPEFAEILRMYFILAPEKVLALSDLVRDGVIDERRAIEMGRGVLRENARRLHGWK